MFKVKPRAVVQSQVTGPSSEVGVADRTTGSIPVTGAKVEPIKIQVYELSNGKLVPARPRRGRPRLEDIGQTLTRTKPWAKLGMSQSTWYRRKAEIRR